MGDPTPTPHTHTYCLTIKKEPNAKSTLLVRIRLNDWLYVPFHGIDTISLPVAECIHNHMNFLL